MDTDERRTKIADDLRKLGDVIRLNAPIPIDEFGPLQIMHCVIEGDHDEREARFNAHTEDMAQVATEMRLDFTYTATVDTIGDTHHRSTLIMPHGEITYRVMWIERKAQADEQY